MQHDTRNTPAICILTPDALENHLFKPRLPLLHEHYPNLKVRLNPKIKLIRPATISIGLSKPHNEMLLSRSVGYLPSQIHDKDATFAQELIPDVIGRFDPVLTGAPRGKPAELTEIWVSINPSVQHIPGIRQTLDWVESCVTTLAWLNESIQVQPPLSKADALR